MMLVFYSFALSVGVQYLLGYDGSIIIFLAPVVYEMVFEFCRAAQTWSPFR